MNDRRTNMKLYTEEQLQYAIMSAIISQIGNSIEFDVAFTLVMDSITPIELPSDEEILNECKIGGMDTKQELCFQLGAKWVINKIQGGKK